MKQSITGVLVVLILLAVGCAPARADLAGSSLAAGLQAWVDAPLDQTSLSLPVTYPVVCHGTSPRGVAAVEFSVDQQSPEILSNPDSGAYLLAARFDWTPARPGMYTLRCRAQDTGGVWSTPAQVVVSVSGPATISPGQIFFRVTQAANCRQGPDTRYPVRTSFPAGTLMMAIGRGLEDEWVQVRDDLTGEHCWIALIVGELQGELTLLPLVEVLPLPEDVPTDTPVAGCWIGGGFTPLACVVPCPTGVPNGGTCTP